MKLVFTLLISILVLSANAQKPVDYAALPKDSATQKVAYTAVVAVPGVNKADLFNRGQEWAARTFVDSKAAGRVADKEAGTILYHGTIQGKPSLGGGDTYGFVLAVYVKDGRYKYLVDQLTDTPHIRGNDPTLPLEMLHTYGNERFVTKRTTEVDAIVKGMIASLGSAMASKPGGKAW